MPKPNALAGIFGLALAARANTALWEDEHPTDRVSGRSSTDPWWEEVETKEVGGGEVARLHAYCRPLGYPPGRHIVIKLKIVVGGLTLPFARVPVGRQEERSRLVLPRGVEWSETGREEALRYLRFLEEAQGRRARAAAAAEAIQAKATPPNWFKKRERALRRSRRWLWSQHGVEPPLLLVPDDIELRALVALRCLQRGCYEAEATSELRSYVQKTGVSIVEGVLEGVLRALAENFVSGPPGALPRYIKVASRFVLGEEAKSGRRSRGGDATVEEAENEEANKNSKSARRRTLRQMTRDGSKRVSEAAADLGVSRRTLYRLLSRGDLVPVRRERGWPYRFTEAEVGRVRADRLYKPIYRVVARLRHCSYDAARMWVRRRRAKALTDLEIIKAAGFPEGYRLA